MSKAGSTEQLQHQAVLANRRAALENIVIGVLAATPIIAVIYFRWLDFVIPVVLAAVAGLALVCPDVRSAVIRRWSPALGDAATILVIVTVAWILASVLWAPRGALLAALKPLVILCGALTVSAALSTIALERIFPPLVYSTLVAMVIAAAGAIAARLVEVPCCPLGFKMDLPGAVPKMILLLWPCLGWLALTKRPKLALMLVLLAALLVSVSRSGAAGLALIAGVAIIGVGWLLPRVALALPATLLVLGFLTAPFLRHLGFLLQWPPLAEYLARFSAAPRIRIWTYYGELLSQRPWHGFGFRAERLVDESFFPAWVVAEKGTLHPHNEPLQILFEFGAIGAALVSATLIALTWRWIRSGHPQTIFVAATAGAFVAAGLVNFSLWESWWFAVVCIAFIFGGRLLESASPRRAPDPPTA